MEGRAESVFGKKETKGVLLKCKVCGGQFVGIPIENIKDAASPLGGSLGIDVDNEFAPEIITCTKCQLEMS